MTGRDLIVYILENNLEDEEIFKDGKLNGFLTREEAAAKLHVGPTTLLWWYELNYIKGFFLSGELYFPKDIKDPRNQRRTE